MKRIICVLFLLLILSTAANAEVTAHFADAAEGRELISSCEVCLNNINTKSMEYFMQSKDCSMDSYIAYCKDQVTDFSPEMQKAIEESLQRVNKCLEDKGLSIPAIGEITFVNTTGNEALGAGGYTHGTTIYLCFGGRIGDMYILPQLSYQLDDIVTHELFHCLSRFDPEFRAKMYSIIGFTIHDEEYSIPEDIRESYILNPDVERHDNSAVFTINGKPTECYLTFMSKDRFENPGDSFFASMYSGLVSVEDGTLYTVDDASDFWDIVGSNTNYVEDPEECMATNFANAVLQTEDLSYPSQWVLDGITDALKK